MAKDFCKEYNSKYQNRHHFNRPVIGFSIVVLLLCLLVSFLDKVSREQYWKQFYNMKSKLYNSIKAEEQYNNENIKSISIIVTDSNDNIYGRNKKLKIKVDICVSIKADVDKLSILDQYQILNQYDNELSSLIYNIFSNSEIKQFVEDTNKEDGTGYKYKEIEIYPIVKFKSLHWEYEVGKYIYLTKKRKGSTDEIKYTRDEVYGISKPSYSQKVYKPKMPYEGMKESYINFTELGSATEVEKCRDFYKLRMDHRSITYRWYRDGYRFPYVVATVYYDDNGEGYVAYVIKYDN